MWFKGLLKWKTLRTESSDGDASTQVSHPENPRARDTMGPPSSATVEKRMKEEVKATLGYKWWRSKMPLARQRWWERFLIAFGRKLEDLEKEAKR